MARVLVQSTLLAALAGFTGATDAMRPRSRD